MEAGAARGAAGYPVDILEDDPEGLQEAALAYHATLEAGVGPPQEVILPTGEQVKPEASSVCFRTMHRDEPRHKILVLVSPRDTKTVVAVYINATWWATEDVLRTSDPARQGLMKVQSFGERIVLFILNVIIFGGLERNLDDDDMFFLPHSVKEQAKILWQDGAAVGFYTTKMKGSLCGEVTGACYLLPVFDTVFVRRSHRRRGLGLAMLRDFCQTFREEEALGVSCPISPAMLQGHTLSWVAARGMNLVQLEKHLDLETINSNRKGSGVRSSCRSRVQPASAPSVCRKFLLAHPEERERLWEVEPPGAWGQRGNIWLEIQLQLPKRSECEQASPDLHLGPAPPPVGPEVHKD